MLFLKKLEEIKDGRDVCYCNNGKDRKETDLWLKDGMCYYVCESAPSKKNVQNDFSWVINWPRT